MEDVFEYLLIIHQQASDEARSVKMAQYMRNQYDFLGVTAPIRKELLRPFFTEYKRQIRPHFRALVKLCWDHKYREMQMTGMDILGKFQKELGPEDILFMEELITRKSWWDTVDWLAANPVGYILKENPKLQKTVPDQWMNSDDFWLQRTAILFQLKYKDEVDAEMLYRFIKSQKDSKEFFIQKACGWALRQYSKYNPDSVIDFLQSTPDLPRLTITEGYKDMKRKGIV